MNKQPNTTAGIMFAAAMVAYHGGMMAWYDDQSALVVGDMVPGNAVGVQWARRYFGVPVIMYHTKE